MLVIRNEQMEAFRRTSRKQFEERLRRHVQDAVPELTVNFEMRISPLVSEALELGIKSEQDVARFCELMFRYAAGMPFSTLPFQAQNLGLAYGVTAHEKLASLDSWFAAREKAGV
jgi:SOS-response transcriptional repressor LexA